MAAAPWLAAGSRLARPAAGVALLGQAAVAGVGTFVVRLAPDAYVTWSDTVDAPVSPVLDRDGLAAFLLAHDALPPAAAHELLRAADETGTSDPAQSLADLLADNSAGPGGTWLSTEEIIRQYREVDGA